MEKYLQGFLMGLAYVAPIGVQNLFVVVFLVEFINFFKSSLFINSIFLIFSYKYRQHKFK